MIFKRNYQNVCIIKKHNTPEGSYHHGIMRKELKEPKNLIGVILTLTGFLLAMWAVAYNKSAVYVYIAAGMYIAGMLLIVLFRDKNKPE